MLEPLDVKFLAAALTIFVLAAALCLRRTKGVKWRLTSGLLGAAAGLLAGGLTTIFVPMSSNAWSQTLISTNVLIGAIALARFQMAEQGLAILCGHACAGILAVVLLK